MRDGSAAERVGARIRELREARGLSIRQLAARAGLGAEVVSRAERGLNSPSVATLERITGGLDVGLDEFFGGKAAPGGLSGVEGGRRGPSAAARRIEALLGPLDAEDRALVVQGLEQLVRGLRADRKRRAEGRERPVMREVAIPNKLVKVIRPETPKRQRATKKKS